MNGDAADRQGPLHAGGHWQDTAWLSHEGSDRQALPACIQSTASSSASGVLLLPSSVSIKCQHIVRLLHIMDSEFTSGKVFAPVSHKIRVTTS